MVVITPVSRRIYIDDSKSTRLKKDNNGQEYPETDRLSHVIAQFTADTKAEAMVSALIDDATTFGADMTPEEEDDITVVVVKVL